ncbi:MAG TPA: hypothetical protein VJL87_06445 [Bdellovibrionota bacterium]|nr:hypothetical protein [Bdellovibrionota bacterium]
MKKITSIFLLLAFLSVPTWGFAKERLFIKAADGREFDLNPTFLEEFGPPEIKRLFLELVWDVQFEKKFVITEKRPVTYPGPEGETVYDPERFNYEGYLLASCINKSNGETLDSVRLGDDEEISLYQLVNSCFSASGLELLYVGDESRELRFSKHNHGTGHDSCVPKPKKRI